jgi:anti-anti-sigma factor
MSCEVEKRDGVIHVRGEMTIYGAAALKDSLFAALDGGSDIVIDLAEVSEVDTTGIQLLMMARRVCATRRVPFSVVRSSEVMNESLALLHLRGWTVPGPDVRTETPETSA